MQLFHDGFPIYTETLINGSASLFILCRSSWLSWPQIHSFFRKVSYLRISWREQKEAGAVCLRDSWW